MSVRPLSSTPPAYPPAAPARPTRTASAPAQTPANPPEVDTIVIPVGVLGPAGHSAFVDSTGAVHVGPPVQEVHAKPESSVAESAYAILKGALPQTFAPVTPLPAFPDAVDEKKDGGN